MVCAGGSVCDADDDDEEEDGAAVPVALRGERCGVETRDGERAGVAPRAPRRAGVD
jgi:hypothetical protein